MRSASDLVPYARNARTHSEQQISMIAGSIREFGFRNPVLVDGDNGIIAGHARVQAALQLGLAKVPCVDCSDMSETQRRAYILADNRLALNAGWDQELLALELTDLSELDVDLEALGFSEIELNQALSNAGAQEGEDECPEIQEQTISERNDVWMLGNHRLMCGDSTSADDVAKLMNGQMADICFTSPPYAQQRDYKKEISDWDALMEGVFSIVPVKPGAQILVNLGLVHSGGVLEQYWQNWLGLMARCNWPLFGWYVWDQGHGMPGNWSGRLAPSHEFVFHFAKSTSQSNKWVRKKKENIKANTSKKGAFRQKDGTLKPVYSGDAYAQPTKVADSVIRINRAPSESAGVGHPAMYPVALCEYMYRSFAKAGDIVYEPFCGSGTSIIASGKFGAACYASEISPAYVDMAVRRWQRFTGEQAMRQDDGASFDDCTLRAA